MKRIVFLTPYVPPTINGIGDYTVHLVKALRAGGLDARLLTSADQKETYPWVHATVDIWSKEGIVRALMPHQPESVVLQFVPQLYHPRGLCPFIADALSAIRRDLKSKTIVTLHEFQTRLALNPKKMFLGLYLRSQTSRILSSCDAVVTTCDGYGQILKKYPIRSQQIRVIPVGANILPVHTESSALSLFRRKYAIQDEKILAVFGRISNFRQMDVALHALAAIRNKGVNALLFIIGNTRSSQPELYKEFLRTAAQLGVQSFLRETGVLTPEEISMSLQISDLFLFPQHDGVSTRSTTVMSALAHGLPIVSYRPAAGNYTGYEIPYGRIAEPGGAQTFASAALELMGEIDDKEKRLLNAAYWQNHFSWETIARAYQDVLDTI